MWVAIRLSESAGTWQQRSQLNFFCEAKKVNLSAVLLHNSKSCDLCGIDDKISFYYYVWQVMGHSVRGLACLWEAWPPCERPSLSVRGPAFPARGMASLWETLHPCERPGPPVRGQASLWEARPYCERPGLAICILANPDLFWNLCTKEFLLSGPPTPHPYSLLSKLIIFFSSFSS